MFSPDSEFSFQRASSFPHSSHCSQTGKINKDIILQTAANTKVPDEFQSRKPESKHVVTNWELAVSYHQAPPSKTSPRTQEMRQLYGSLVPSCQVARADITAAFARANLRQERGGRREPTCITHILVMLGMTTALNSCCFPL